MEYEIPNVVTDVSQLEERNPHPNKTINKIKVCFTLIYLRITVFVSDDDHSTT